VTSIAENGSQRRVAIGIDTHKFIHVAVAVDDLGTFLGDIAVSVDQGGYERLHNWATSQGPVIAFGIEGTGSYGVALTSFLRRRGHSIIEVARPDRRDRRLRGKSDILDAENAAAWLDGTLLGKGHAHHPDEAFTQAQELVDPQDIDDLKIDYRGRSVQWP